MEVAVTREALQLEEISIHINQQKEIWSLQLPVVYKCRVEEQHTFESKRSSQYLKSSKIQD